MISHLSKIRFRTEALQYVIPAKAGIHFFKRMDSRLLPAGMTEKQHVVALVRSSDHNSLHLRDTTLVLI